jgi:hypothetical protein
MKKQHLYHVTMWFLRYFTQIHDFAMQREIPLSSAEALVFLGFNITMRYISLHFTWRISEHERSRWAKERIKASAEERGEIL